MGRAANIIFTVLYIAYNIAGHSFVIWVIIHYDLSPVPSLILIVEQVG